MINLQKPDFFFLRTNKVCSNFKQRRGKAYLKNIKLFIFITNEMKQDSLLNWDGKGQRFCYAKGQ